MKKCLKFRPKLTKYSKIHNFENFMHFLSIFRKTWWLRMSKMLNKEKLVVSEASLKRWKQFVLKKCIKFWPKLRKYLKIQIFENFMQFLCTFRKTWWLRMLKTFGKEQIRCRGCFFEEIKAIGVEKCIKFWPNWQEHKQNSNFEIFV